MDRIGQMEELVTAVMAAVKPLNISAAVSGLVSGHKAASRWVSFTVMTRVSFAPLLTSRSILLKNSC
jgi:hypothetical protein